MMKKTVTQLLEETKQYVEFLTKRLASKNYKANVTPEEKLKKAKDRLKLLS